MKLIKKQFVGEPTEQQNKGPWTQFWDMHSGGRLKTDYDKIYIQETEKEAARIFYNIFGQNPYDTACSCCGQNYSIDEADLEELSRYHRGSNFNDYINEENVLVIFKEDIKEEWRSGSYVDGNSYLDDYYDPADE